MEKILFPLKYMKVTQGMGGSYSHKGTHAIDYGWGGDEKVYAPFTGTVKIVGGGGNANGIWLASNEKVEFADGTIDYAVIKVAHDNDISDMYVGKVIKQGEHFYNMGTAGNVTGKHVHIEMARGSHAGWHKNQDGVWMIDNSIDQTKAFFVPRDVEIIKDGGYGWRFLVEHVGTPVERNLYVEQAEVLIDNLRARTAPNGDKLGYINKGIYNIIDTKRDGDYTWYNVEPNIWIAYNEEWTTHLTAIEEKPSAEKIQDDLEKAKKENQELKIKIMELEKELEAYKTYKEFSAPAKGVYYIDLGESEKVLYKD